MLQLIRWLTKWWEKNNRTKCGAGELCVYFLVSARDILTFLIVNKNNVIYYNTDAHIHTHTHTRTWTVSHDINSAVYCCLWIKWESSTELKCPSFRTEPTSTLIESTLIHSDRSETQNRKRNTKKKSDSLRVAVRFVHNMFSSLKTQRWAAFTLPTPIRHRIFELWKKYPTDSALTELCEFSIAIYWSSTKIFHSHCIREKQLSLMHYSKHLKIDLPLKNANAATHKIFGFRLWSIDHWIVSLLQPSKSKFHLKERTQSI